MLSAKGRCQTFDAAADGYVRSEGGGALVLGAQPGSGAWPLVAGSAVRQDGRSASLTAPNGSAQKVLLGTALYVAGVRVEQLPLTLTICISLTLALALALALALPLTLALTLALTLTLTLTRCASSSCATSRRTARLTLTLTPTLTPTPTLTLALTRHGHGARRPNRDARHH